MHVLFNSFIISVCVHVFLSSSQCSECLRVLSMGNSLVNLAHGQKGQIWTCGLVIANVHIDWKRSTSMNGYYLYFLFYH